MNKLKRVLLVDDCEATNFLHTMLIEEYGCAENVVVKLNGREALDYLITEEEGAFPQPELVFLDINMPVMNGWEFLEEYESLEVGQRAGAVVVMLTTSLNPGDRIKAEAHSGIKSFETKPLSLEKIDEVLKLFHPECLRVEALNR